MTGYQPPYTISDEMLCRVAAISEKIERIGGRHLLDARPHLRKNNRIRSIHSSLAIEANSLSLPEVRDVINGKTVIGDRKDIQEVKNACAAYERLTAINPYALDELKETHALMTAGTVSESGIFRSGGEGVFSGEECVFVAPPPAMVPGLMEDLFAWMREHETDVHPLIMAAVFHYEFVFIHPFADGNGRMARLWHTALLYRWRSIFEFIPLESQIEKFQIEYYEAIAACHKNGNSNVFIEFMLRRIDEILDDVLERLQRENAELTAYVQRLLDAMEYDVPYSTAVLMERLGLKSRETFRKNYMDPALSLGIVQMTIPDKPNSRNQRYVKK